MITFAAVEDNLLIADTLRAWASTVPDIAVVAVAESVADLLCGGNATRPDVVLLSVTLRAEPDPAENVRRLIASGHRVIVLDGSQDLLQVAPALAAGAHGYLTRDHDATALAATVRAVAAGGTAWSLGPTPTARNAHLPGRPPLSHREHAVLMAYVSGLTLDAAARSLSISTETARTYLKRVKAKYRQAGLPVYTKLDLAAQVRADCHSGECQVNGAIKAP